MAPPRISPSQCVLVLQALVARELVEGMGLSGARAAELLGVAPSAISQYLTGKRRTRPLDELGARADVQELARSVARSLTAGSPSGRPPMRPLLEAAATLFEASAGPPTGTSPQPRPRHRELARVLRDRVAAEQGAVTDCMHLAQKSRDELTRAIFRQLASDSLRHAEIAASLSSYLERGIDATWASGITKTDVQRLIRREHEAEHRSAEPAEGTVGGVMALLAASMEADERKHTELLEEMLRTGFLAEPAPPGATVRRGRAASRGRTARAD